jgi:hypothetical protein
LLLSVSGLLARDAPDTDLSGYETNYRNLYQIAAAADIQKAKERGSNKTTEDIAESVFAEIKAHADSYNRWMEKNYLTQGEYFGSSPSLRDELTFCRTIAEML